MEERLRDPETCVWVLVVLFAVTIGSSLTAPWESPVTSSKMGISMPTLSDWKARVLEAADVLSSE